jgi:hypothetical protein
VVIKDRHELFSQLQIDTFLRKIEAMNYLTIGAWGADKSTLLIRLFSGCFNNS